MAQSLRRIPAGRWLLGAALVLSWDVMELTLDKLPYPRGLGALVDLQLLAGPLASLALRALFYASIAAFVLRRRQLWAGACALGLMALRNHLLLCQWPADAGLREDRYVIGACFSAYLIGYALARARPQVEREYLGQEAACGAFGAVYTLAGLAKLFASGPGWVAGTNLSRSILERCGEGPAIYQWIRLQVAARLDLCAALAAAALAVELCGAALVWKPTRRLYAGLAIALHAGFNVLFGYFDVVWVVLLAALACSHVAGPRE